MKRIAVWVFYGIGALAVGYLVLYAYAAFKGRDLQPGDPIHIFRKPDAPDYSWRASKILASFRVWSFGPSRNDGVWIASSPRSRNDRGPITPA